MNLSKSRFLVGRQCHKRLWWTMREPDAPELQIDREATPVVRGRAVGELARAHVPGGVLIDLPHYELEGRVAATRAAVAGGAAVVYEASFVGGGAFASVDILERRGRGFVLTEVKSTLDVKEHHLPDVALQAHVLRAAGVELKGVEVMHLNRQCRHPDLSNLFMRVAVTREVRPWLRAVPEEMAEMQRALQGPLPQVEVGPHCMEPTPCPFHARCWPKAPEHHVSTLYRITRKKLEKLRRAGYETLHDLPDDFKASGPAKRQIKSARAGEVVVERGLGRALAKLKAPLAFLDFETIMPAVPAWPGYGPYAQVPVQLSCHVVGAGTLVHRQWLADGGDDPREPFAQALLAACDGAQTIVAYNASFEVQRIERLIEDIPALSPRLKKLRKRIVDLLPIVREHVYHPAFQGSFSLKSVLPALVPGLGYGDLEVKDGSTAAALLEQLLLDGSALTPESRQELRAKLLSYCERDTLAMVKLYERLTELAAS